MRPPGAIASELTASTASRGGARNPESAGIEVQPVGVRS